MILPVEERWILPGLLSRRAERQVVDLSDSDGIENPAIIAYLNRLSVALICVGAVGIKNFRTEYPQVRQRKPEK